MKTQINYNPDVLSCLANLSNDEVFTPPNIVNQMLDLLPESIWSDKNATFLDPVSKTGVFLREIALRLNEGLKDQIPDTQERINHIYTKQVFGIAITELTSLLSRRSVYCSKKANGKYSVCDKFTDEQGNIRYERLEHTWVNSSCKYCGANQSEYDRDDALETYAYQFIHTDDPAKIFNNMKFDVIIGNPPYQLSDGGFGRSASPIYHLFIKQAKKMNPRYLTMIIPARWYAGGKGLDDFRQEMLGDDRMRKIVDFENASQVFPGVDIAGGVCYFLWSKDSSGPCEVVNDYDGTRVSSVRSLNEFETFIRHGQAVPIIRKVLAKHNGAMLSERVSPRKPFGLPTNYEPKNKGIPCWFTQKLGSKFANQSDVNDELKVLNKWKVLVPPAPIAGQTDFSKPISFYYDSNTIIAKPGECCTESWLVAGAFDTKSEAESFKTYLFTKLARFLLLQTVVSQHVTKQKFSFVPDLGKYSGEYTDEALIKLWGLTKQEWAFVDSKIK